MRQPGSSETLVNLAAVLGYSGVSIVHVAIVGAGLTGITSAYFLRQHGIDVTVLEKEAGPALGASYGNGGLLQTSAPEPWNMPGIFGVFAQAWVAGLSGKGEKSAFVTRTLALPGLAGWGLRFLKHANTADYLGQTVKNMRLASYTADTIRELNTSESLSFSYSNCGSMFLFRDRPSMTGYLELAEHVGEHGARFETLDRDALLRKEPSLTDIGDELVGAVYYPDDSAGNSRHFCEQMAQISTTNGVAFNFETLVSRINATQSGVAIKTNTGEIRADAVILAAGSYTTKLASRLGIRLPIAPAKGYSISIPMRDWKNRPSHVLGDMGVHAGVNALGDILRVAGTAEFAGLREGISTERTDYLIDLTRKIFPKFAATINREEIDPWGGLRPLSADGVPIIGATKVANIFVNSGHGGLGVTQAAGSSRALADQIAGVRDPFDLSDFSPGRF